jgi:hypothetical protein
MKTVRIVMEIVIENDSPADNWIYQEIESQLTQGEGIIDWQYEVLSTDSAPLEDIELFNKS